MHQGFAYTPMALTRRTLVKTLLTAGAWISSRRRADASTPGAVAAATPNPNVASEQPFDPEFVVVGSGPGGGTVAARLVEKGFRVLVLEAGGDPRKLTGANPVSIGANALPEDYDVPGFHALSTENEALRWDFFVRHYADAAQQKKDPKYIETYNGKRVDGIYYPRAATLGGCSAHNAMIFVAPHNSDWDQIADITNDPSWRAENMWKYFQRLENCHYRPLERFLHAIGLNPSRHGWSGWLSIERAIPLAAIFDRDLRKLFLRSSRKALELLGHIVGAETRWLDESDPNDWRVVNDSAPGVRATPLTTKDHARMGSRERLLEVQQRHPDRLKIELNALATRVLFDAQKRAIGVEYLEGAHLYRADPRASGSGVKKEVKASREVILAGGAFNTPQLLMLSGVGDPAELAAAGITQVVSPLAGVGKNLQDRYEVGVISHMKAPWGVLKGATFLKGDAQYREWDDDRQGIYKTNGTLVSVVLPSQPGKPVPDLFCYSLLAKFPGYFPGYSKLLPQHPDYLTWAVLKGHTNNTAGSVTLESNDPLQPPKINFKYFEEGNDATGDDLRSVVEGIKFVRLLMADPEQQAVVEAEELPGPSFDTPEKLKTFVRDHAWGHHASCTCRIGRSEEGGVLSSDFKVHGTQGLRVVDASVFPRIPGLFIASAVYMIGEKAADVIAADAGRS
jgi:choline dehydrogenase